MCYKPSKSLAYAMMGLALAATSGAALADVLVTYSSGAAARAYPRGARLDDNAQIVLGRNDRVTVLTSGGTRQYRGPGTYSASGPRQIASSLAARGSASARARTGVSRGDLATDGTTPARDVWQLDIGQTGLFCYLPGQPVTLWRADAQSPSAMTITGENSATVSFAANQWTQSWPTTLTASSGSEYRISWPGGAAPTQVKFVELTAEADDTVDIGAELLANGCERQLEALMAQADETAVAE